MALKSKQILFLTDKEQQLTLKAHFWLYHVKRDVLKHTVKVWDLAISPEQLFIGTNMFEKYGNMHPPP